VAQSGPLLVLDGGQWLPVYGNPNMPKQLLPAQRIIFSIFNALVFN